MPLTLDDCCGRRLSWRATGDAEFPYAVAVEGRGWLIRINDFPVDALYTLLIDGGELGDFDDWPPAWRRPD